VRSALSMVRVTEPRARVSVDDLRCNRRCPEGRALGRHGVDVPVDRQVPPPKSTTAPAANVSAFWASPELMTSLNPLRLTEPVVATSDGGHH